MTFAVAVACVCSQSVSRAGASCPARAERSSEHGEALPLIITCCVSCQWTCAFITRDQSQSPVGAKERSRKTAVL